MLRAETTFLITALPAAGDEWKVYERPLVRCIASPDPLPAMRLVDALRRADDPKLIAHLSQLLIARSGAAQIDGKERCDRGGSPGSAAKVPASRRPIAGSACRTR